MTTTQPTIAKMEARVAAWVGDTFPMRALEYGSDRNLWPPIYLKLYECGLIGKFADNVARGIWEDWRREFGKDGTLPSRDAALFFAIPEQQLRALYAVLPPPDPARPHPSRTKA